MDIPTLGGNWVDLVILVFLVLYVWGGLERGFLVLMGEMASFVASFVVALRFYPQASRLLMANFSISIEFAKAVGFILVAVGVEMALGILLGFLFQRLPREWFLMKWNKILGVAPALVDGVILVGFVATAVVGLPVNGVIKQDVLKSRIGGWLISNTRVFEKSLDDVFGGAIQQTLGFLTVRTGSDESVNLNFRTNSFSVDAVSERRMLDLVNNERATRGLKPLLADEKLAEVARQHSKDMFIRGYFSHITPEGKDPFARMNEAGISYGSAGENIALTPSVEIAHEGLMNSPGHRENILSREFGKVGIGVVDGGIFGKMFTQDFSD